jgi:hypothetical protein
MTNELKLHGAALLEKLTVPHLLKFPPAVCGTQRFSKNTQNRPSLIPFLSKINSVHSLYLQTPF